MALFNYTTCKQTIKGAVAKGLSDVSYHANDKLQRIQQMQRANRENEALEESRRKNQPNRPTVDFLGRQVHVTVMQLPNPDAFGVSIDVPDANGKPYTMLTVHSGTHYMGRRLEPYMAYLNTWDLPGPELVSFVEQMGLAKPVQVDGEPVWMRLGEKGRQNPLVLYQFEPKVLAKFDQMGFYREAQKQESKAFGRTMREHVHYTKEDGVTFDEGFDPTDIFRKQTDMEFE